MSGYNIKWLNSPEKNIISLQKAEVLKNLKICLLKKIINTFNRHDSRCKHKKLSEIGLEKIAKILNTSENEVNQAKKLKKYIYI